MHENEPHKNNALINKKVYSSNNLMEKSKQENFNNLNKLGFNNNNNNCFNIDSFVFENNNNNNINYNQSNNNSINMNNYVFQQNQFDNNNRGGKRISKKNLANENFNDINQNTIINNNNFNKNSIQIRNNINNSVNNMNSSIKGNNLNSKNTLSNLNNNNNFTSSAYNQVNNQFEILDDEKFDNFIERIGDNLKFLIKNQKGSRSMQKFLDKIYPEHVNLLLLRISSDLKEIMMDPYGNYFIQKLIQCSSSNQRMTILNTVKILIFKFKSFLKILLSIQNNSYFQILMIYLKFKLKFSNFL